MIDFPQTGVFRVTWFVISCKVSDFVNDNNSETVQDRVIVVIED